MFETVSMLKMYYVLIKIKNFFNKYIDLIFTILAIITERLFLY